MEFDLTYPLLQRPRKRAANPFIDEMALVDEDEEEEEEEEEYGREGRLTILQLQHQVHTTDMQHNRWLY